MPAASGITFTQFANNNSMRNIYVLGVSLFLGLSIPQYFAMNTTYVGHGPVRTNAGWVSSMYCDFELLVHVFWLDITWDYDPCSSITY